MILCLLLLAQDVATLSAQGAAAMRSQKFSEAETVYRKLIETQPTNPMWRFNLGLALYSGKRYVESAKELQTFLEVQPEPGPAHVMLGASLLRIGKACDAVEPLETGVQWRASPETLPQLAEAYYGCRRYADAAKAYSRAGDERSAARCYWQARQYSEAVARFRKLESTHADDSDFQYEFGDSLVRLSGADAGVSHLERAVQLNPSLLPARGELGKALLELGRAHDAIPHLDAASGEDPTLLLPLARALRSTGRTDEAALVQAEYRKRVGEAQK
jgi:superkiller protein 3